MECGNDLIVEEDIQVDTGDVQIRQGDLIIEAGSACKPGGGSFSTCSDVRLKRDSRPLEDSLSLLLVLRGVSFEYRDAGDS